MSVNVSKASGEVFEDLAEEMERRGSAPGLEEYEVLMKSYLYKRSRKTHQWKRRWVVLRKSQLSYYKDTLEYKALKVFHKNELLSFSCIPDGHRHHFAVYTSNRVLHFTASEDGTYKKWIDILGEFFKRQIELSMCLGEQLTAADKFGVVGVGDTTNTTGEADTYKHVLKEEDVNHRTEENVLLASKEQKELFKTNINLHGSNPGNEFIVEQGYVNVLNKRYNQWKKLYLILTNHGLYLFKSQSDVHLTKIHKVLLVNDLIDAIILDPISKTRKWCFLVITPLKRIRVNVSSEKEVLSWVSALKILTDKTRSYS